MSLIPELGVKSLVGTAPRVPHSAPVQSHGPATLPPGQNLPLPLAVILAWDPLTWATWHQAVHPSSTTYSLVTLDACHLFLSLGFVVSKMNVMPVWQDQMCTGWHQRPPGRGAEEERSSAGPAGLGGPAARMGREVAAPWAPRCSMAVRRSQLFPRRLVPGKMKEYAPALAGAPLILEDSWRQCVASNPDEGSTPLCLFVFILQQRKCISCWEKEC